MKQELNNMEMALLISIVDKNKMQYPFLLEHINFLYVKSRENNLVGMYSNFVYSKYFQPNDLNILISSDKMLKIDGFENEATFVLDISNGKICFLEIVANGNDIFIKDKFIYDFKLY